MTHRRTIAGAALAFATLGLGGCASGGPVPAEAEVPAGDLSLRMSGRGGWSVDCTAMTSRGREARADARGVASDTSQKIFLQDVVSAECNWQAGDAPLTLGLAEEGLACPFGTFRDGICQITHEAGTSGTLTFAPS